MPENFSIDLDAERVLIDGAWFTREELAARIKAMVDSGDFRLARPSAAMEALEHTLANLASFTFKLPTETLVALSGAAGRSGKSMESFAREIIERAIGAASSSTLSPVQLVQPEAAPPIPLTAPAQHPPADAPIALTPKKPATAPVSDAEKGWFNRR